MLLVHSKPTTDNIGVKVALSCNGEGQKFVGTVYRLCQYICRALLREHRPR